MYSGDDGQAPLDITYIPSDGGGIGYGHNTNSLGRSGSGCGPN
jgi:hypothetical protein